MAQDRLSGLTLIHIHYVMEIDLDEVMTIFSKEPHKYCVTEVLCLDCSTLESAEGSPSSRVATLLGSHELKTIRHIGYLL